MHYEKSPELRKAEEADAKLAKSLSPEEKIEFPGPATVTPEISEEDIEVLENRLTEETKKLARVIELPKKKKPDESGPSKKAA